MRRYILTLLSILLAFGGLCAQSKPQKLNRRNDSKANTVRLKSLQSQKERLVKEIKMADSKRGKHIPGVAPETMEAMNDRQDSICLDLRSRLTDVILEMQELSPAPNLSPSDIQHFLTNNRTDTIIKKQK